ncbi:MAG: thermonuclease family protein [Candidatus Omnitrophica bacterium]|jgi:micrococcal nuclease|nr:thermonuclease family protein [Candidatus Omnitrophota bacterium]MCF7888270.1 thermonuclease family protein [Candidatus Omnitrophota bacterium]
MAEFTVSEVVDGDTFKVKSGWKWNEKKGNFVRPTGYNTPERGEPGYEQAKQKLKKLILGKKVDIRSVKTIDKWGRLVAQVYYNGKDLADYFNNENKGIVFGS